ncbi:hypothetical protein XENORESO_001833 [Xenotaenia resolanae]|uniref:Secreted protein n=1 Tax=Xenotaenia resolanae TaxID=208358 RepID=A0ABV0W162_9TELE
MILQFVKPLLAAITQLLFLYMTLTVFDIVVEKVWPSFLSTTLLHCLDQPVFPKLYTDVFTFDSRIYWCSGSTQRVKRGQVLRLQKQVLIITPPPPCLTVEMSCLVHLVFSINGTLHFRKISLICS